MNKTTPAEFVAAVRRRLPRPRAGLPPWIGDRAAWLLFALFGALLAVVTGLALYHGEPESSPTQLAAGVGGKAEAAVALQEETPTRRRTTPAPTPRVGPAAPGAAGTHAPAPSPAEVYERIFGEQDAIEAELAEALTRFAPQLSSGQTARIRLLRRVCGTGRFLQELTAARTVGPLPDELQRCVQQLAQRWTATEAGVSRCEGQSQ